MVAFRCLCGWSTTNVDYTIPSDKEGYSHILCSKECYEKYKDKDKK